MNEIAINFHFSPMTEIAKTFYFFFSLSTIQVRKLFKGGNYMRKYGNYEMKRFREPNEIFLKSKVNRTW